MDELPDEIYDEVLECSEKGNVLMEQKEYQRAIDTFEAAFKKLPAPVEKWDAFLWLKASIGDARFFMKDYEEAAEIFFDAMNGPDGAHNPFILLRLGQCLYEQGSERAIDYMCKAYFLEGEEIFSDEDEKYFNAVKGALSVR
ncbi:tetratricopeptide repeat protein [Pseudomonas alabamensis]|uniref:tetratricopeptide repeat protein n=1 Tax=Pseudomonas alabamensis TaxID=3064349 RepID=UPI000745B05C|nr:hypothetical protein APT63_08910 [Pseudomonas monteilii]